MPVGEPDGVGGGKTGEPLRRLVRVGNGNRTEISSPNGHTKPQFGHTAGEYGEAAETKIAAHRV